jgi:hypothetical protein
MTDLLKRIRTMADRVGQQRGRPILIAVRAPDSVEYSRAIGLDIEKWMADDLLDLYIAAGTYQLNDWNYSVALARKHGVKIYSSLDDSHVKDPGGRERRMTSFSYRGQAANAWAAGVDGIYLYNFFIPFKSDSSLLREIGSPDTLANLDKDYLPAIRGVIRSSGGNLPYNEYIHAETLNPGNPKTIVSGGPTTTRINLAETLQQLQAAEFTVKLQFSNPLRPDDVAVRINNKPIGSLQAHDRWLQGLVANGALRSGENRLEVGLMNQNPGQVLWTDLVIEKRTTSKTQLP